MNTPFGNRGETVIIPAVTLTGTREEKLGQLDDFLVQLHVVRRALACDPAAVNGDVLMDETRPGPRASPGWRRPGASVLRWVGRASRVIGSIGIGFSD